jgi:hypothetical protein
LHEVFQISAGFRLNLELACLAQLLELFGHFGGKLRAMLANVKLAVLILVYDS